MKLEYEKDFYCEECKARTSSCINNDLCVAEIEFGERNRRIGQLIRQENGGMTIGDIISLHGRVAALKVLGEFKLAKELEKAEKLLERYFIMWDEQDLSLSQRKEWINNQTEVVQEEINEAFKVSHRKVGVLLMNKREEFL